MTNLQKLQKENESIKIQLENASKQIINLISDIQVMKSTLELIATPKRIDGTYNHCREACELIAKETLFKLNK